ncbi:MAG: hypothetical protein KAG92_02210 [Deltaproteobacteria bacterium]|nr:hypothetical protein [Deltaproteobacteria bacterium]
MLDTPRYKPVRLIPFILLSSLLHSAFLLALPDLTRLFDIHIRRMIPLSRVEMEVDLIKPKLKPEPEPKPESKSGTTENPSPALIDEHISSLIDERLQESSALGDTPVPPPAAIELPSVETSNETSMTTLPLPETDPLAPPQELLGRLGQRSLGRLSGRHLDGIFDDEQEKSTSELTRLLSADAKKALLALAVPAKKVAEHEYGLSGPVAVSREVLFRPALPQVTLVRDVTVSFRFWVRPDGSVSRIETRRIGDLELVNVAERYLQQWRFSSLSSGLRQQEQWGTVNITFRVPR